MERGTRPHVHFAYVAVTADGLTAVSGNSKSQIPNSKPDLERAQSALRQHDRTTARRCAERAYEAATPPTKLTISSVTAWGYS